jgi:DNA-binding response OmpR family regulator
MKVLIIDDDSFIRDLYQRVFELEKHETEMAQDGAEALAILGKMDKLPNAIILDLMMPHMDGFEFLKKVKADPAFQNIPVIILSNLYSREDRKKGLDSGAAIYLVKSEHDPKEIVAQTLTVANG